MRLALGLIPLLSGLLIWLSVRRVGQSLGNRPGGRLAFLLTSLLASAWVVVGTESLSYFSRLTFWPVFLWWTLPILLCGGYLLARRPDIPTLNCLRDTRWTERLLGATLIGLWGVALFTAIAYPGNTTDVRSYHLPRQFFWYQQGSVSHFPTSDLRQLFNPPLAEYAGLHWMILTDSDRWVSVPGWLAFVGLGLVTSLIVQLLGGSRAAQLCSALFVSTAPMAFMQASSGKNDLASTYWIMALLYWLVRLLQAKAFGWSDAIVLGSLAGFCLLTKGTTVVYTLPIALLTLVPLVRAIGWRTLMKCAPLVIAIACVLNASYWHRNWTMSRTLMTVPDVPNYPGNYSFGNHVHSAKSLASNVVRNLALHLATPSTAFNEKVAERVTRFHDWLGFDQNDPRTTWTHTQFTVTNANFSEDVAAAPLHLLLATGALALTPLILFDRRRSWIEKTLWFLPLAELLCFSFLLKWQPWHVRLHIPFIAMQAIPLALLFRGRWVDGVGLLMSMVGIAVLAPTVLFSAERALVTHDGKLAVLVHSADEFYYRDRLDSAMTTRQYLLEHHPRTIGVQVGHPLEAYDIIRLVGFRADWSGELYISRPWLFTYPSGTGPRTPDVIVGPEGYESHMIAGTHEYRSGELFSPFQIMRPAQQVP